MISYLLLRRLNGERNGVLKVDTDKKRIDYFRYPVATESIRRSLAVELLYDYGVIIIAQVPVSTNRAKIVPCRQLHALQLFREG